MTAPHPLKILSDLATVQNVLPHELIVDHGGALVRIRTKSGLWVMRKSEDGSIMDRWSDADGMVLVKLTEDQIAQGAPAILADLLSHPKAKPV